jgi:translation elongation factor aEF-1 beta
MIKMNLLLARLKIFPNDAGIKSEEIVGSIIDKLPKGMNIRNNKDEPIAFGLSATILDVQLEDKEGAMDLLEKTIMKSPKVSQIEVIATTLA